MAWAGLGVVMEAWGSKRLWRAPLELLIRWHAMHLTKVQVCRVWRHLLYDGTFVESSHPYAQTARTGFSSRTTGAIFRGRDSAYVSRHLGPTSIHFYDPRCSNT
jgi:hypothetical protein